MAFFLFQTPSFAQTEVGILVGGSYYYGDIVNEIEPTTMRYSFGGFLRYHLNDRVALKFMGAYARVTGADSLSESEFQRNRNLDFFTDIVEGSVQLEYNLISDYAKGRRYKNRFIPYLFVGIGAFWFNPQAIYPVDGSTISLATLQTEGVKYSQVAACIPFGAGFRYRMDKSWSIGLEVGVRYTTTSYIDDVSGNGVYPELSQLPYAASYVMYDRSKFPRNPALGYGYGAPGKVRGKMGNIQDIYVIGGLTITYKLGGGGGGFSGRAVRCPRFY